MMADAFDVFGDSLVPLLVTLAGAMALAGLRWLPVVMMLPPFNLIGLPNGLLRGGLVFGLSSFHLPFLWPLVQGRDHPMSPIGDLPILIVISKELFIGLIIGFAMSLPFWIASAVGNLIDTQSGAQMSGFVDPGTGEDSTPSGVFMMLAILAICVEAGFFHFVLVPTVLDSYAAWPVDSLGPGGLMPLIEFFMQMFGRLLVTAATLAMPFIIGMLLVDVGLAYTARFAPSINPFVLSMGGKVILTSILLVLYYQVLERHLFDLLGGYSGLLPLLGGL